MARGFVYGRQCCPRPCSFDDPPRRGRSSGEFSRLDRNPRIMGKLCWSTRQTQLLHVVNPLEVPMNLSPNATTVLEKRYLKKNDSGKVVETPEEMLRRVSESVADAERLYGTSEDEISAVRARCYRSMA